MVENGPAAEAGIHKGDLVVSINGKPTREWFLPDLRDELCDPHVDSITMVVRGPDHLTTHTIRLQILVE
jgi:C-terminal processing protease CtpA/Prc